MAVAAAVALRHPRVLLRQAHFLWCLSSRDSTTPKAAAEPGQRHSADLRSRDEKRAEDSYVRGNRSDDLQRACQQEFRSRIGMLAESLQLAACAGLLPPFAASLLPTCSSNGVGPRLREAKLRRRQRWRRLQVSTPRRQTHHHSS